MPAQITIFHAQLETIHEESNGHHIVVCESPQTHAEGAFQGVLEIWVIDQESQDTDTHRSIFVDREGNVLGDEQESDYAG